MNIKSEDRREDVHFRVLRLLEDHPDYSQREIADALGISLGRVNYCLKALIQRGSVKVDNFRAASNKLNYAYVLTPRGIADKAALTARFLARKMREFEALKAEIEALSGRAIHADQPNSSTDEVMGGEPKAGSAHEKG